MKKLEVTNETARLRVVPYAPQHILALLDGYEPFAASFGIPAAEGLREMYTSGDISEAWLSQLKESTSADPWQHGWGVIHQARSLVIGSVGFKGPPDGDGMVELAYGIVPSFQGQGYATEAAQGAIALAIADDRVRLLRAHTLPAANASTRVLSKCGFDFVGEVHDPEDGRVWRWERALEFVMQSRIRYLNTDLDLSSADDLTELSAVFKLKRVPPLHVGRGEDGLWYATFETYDQNTEPEPNISEMVAVAESLAEPHRSVWLGCSLREFNIGYDCGDEPWAFNQGLSCDLLRRIAAINASLRWTLYPDRGR